MKRLQKILAQVEQSEIEEALKSKDINIGAEFEFLFQESYEGQRQLKPEVLKLLEKATKSPINIEPWLKYKSHTHKKVKGWKLEIDISLPEKTGAELISPPLPLQEFLKICPEVFKAIEMVGKTTDKCGFHVGISTKNISKIDPLKLALFMDEDLVWKAFRKEARSKYGSSIKDLINDLIGDKDIVDIYRKQIEKALKDTVTTSLRGFTKAYGINAGKLQNGYVEFRYMGGKDYHKKWKEIRNIIGMYIFTLKIAIDQNYKKEEYKEKLVELFKDEVEKQKKLKKDTRKWIPSIEKFLKTFNLKIKNVKRSKHFVYVELTSEVSEIGSLALLLLNIELNDNVLKIPVKELFSLKKFKFTGKFTIENMFKYLVDHRANVHADNDYALQWASKNGYLDIVKYLKNI